jgi:hypothetical protein
MSAETLSHDCLQERRRQLRKSRDVFGLDFVEVCPAKSGRSEGHFGRRRQTRTFWLHFIGRRPEWLQSEHVLFYELPNGPRLRVDAVENGDEHPAKVHLSVEEVCEGVEYSLTVTVPKNKAPDLDPFFSSLTFRFDPGQPAETDCLPVPFVRLPGPPGPEINYLAKDYATFRQLLLDRLAVTLPDWQESSPADLGVTLVEILAYSADHLSYFQDAVATEAYLGTARLRQSLRRHARLVDYRVHEGCNARAWVHLQVSTNFTIENAQDLFFVAIPRSLAPLRAQPLTTSTLDDLMNTRRGCEVFEPVVSKSFRLWLSHNECRLYDWHGAQPCLKKGATSAWLINQSQTDEATAGKSLHFQVGDVLLLEEVLSPWTGCTNDADTSHRHFIRITTVAYDEHDSLFQVPLVKITWDESDALPFTLWITKPHDAKWDCDDGTAVTVARGNVLLVDHGRSIRQDDVNLATSHGPPPSPFVANYPSARIRATLSSSNLTFSDGLPISGASATDQFKQDPRGATPQILLQAKSRRQGLAEEFSILELRDLRRIAKRLLDRVVKGVDRKVPDKLKLAAKYISRVREACGCQNDADYADELVDLGALRRAIKNDLRDVWTARYDLLDSSSADAHFVVEMTDDRQAILRFGQDGFGRVPDLENDPNLAEMLADYRIGNGTVGNVPTEAIQVFGSYGRTVADIEAVRNPLPAAGGVDPETAREIRLFAPHAIRSRLQRAVTAHDYERIVMREFGDFLQQAKATLLWTGHEFVVLVAIDPKSHRIPLPELRRRIRNRLRRYRRIGHCVRVRLAQQVVPSLALSVCVGPRVIKDDVAKRLNELFSSQVLPDGSLAFFHPDQSTFGEGVFVSQIVTTAARVPGVIHVEVTALHRSDEGAADELENCVLPLGPQEIVRFDNNRQNPKSGFLVLEIKGGR